MSFSIFLTFIVLVVCFLVLVIFLGVLFLAQPFFSVVPFIPAQKRVVEEIVEAFGMKPGDVLYDLGCGDGRILFEAARQYPDARFIGYEISPLPYFISKIKLYFTSRKNIEIHYGNFFDVDLSSVTHVFAYLYPVVIAKLALKLERELKPGALFFSLQFKISEGNGKKPTKEIVFANKSELNSMLYMYEF